MDPEVVEHMGLPVSNGEQRRVRRWLEDAWRHGEIVADDDGLLPEDAEETQPEPMPLRPSHAREPADWSEPRQGRT